MPDPSRNETRAVAPGPVCGARSVGGMGGADAALIFRVPGWVLGGGRSVIGFAISGSAEPGAIEIAGRIPIPGWTATSEA